MAINIGIKNLNMAIDKGAQEAFLNLVANIQTIIPYYCYNDKIYNYIFNPDYECDLDDLNYSIDACLCKYNKKVNEKLWVTSVQKWLPDENAYFYCIFNDYFAISFEAEDVIWDIERGSIRPWSEW